MIEEYKIEVFDINSKKIKRAKHWKLCDVLFQLVLWCYHHLNETPSRLYSSFESDYVVFIETVRQTQTQTQTIIESEIILFSINYHIIDQKWD